MWLCSLSAAVHNFCANPQVAPLEAGEGPDGRGFNRSASASWASRCFRRAAIAHPWCSFCPALMALGGKHYNVDGATLRTTAKRASTDKGLP